MIPIKLSRDAANCIRNESEYLRSYVGTPTKHPQQSEIEFIVAHLCLRRQGLGSEPDLCDKRIRLTMSLVCVIHCQNSLVIS